MDDFAIPTQPARPSLAFTLPDRSRSTNLSGQYTLAGGLFQVVGHGEGGEHDGKAGLDGGSWPGCASIHFRTT